jgi:hypothetical protein
MKHCSKPDSAPRIPGGFLVKASLFLWALWGASAFACTIPVFRYALDRWEADKFRLVVPATVARQPEIARLLVPLRGNAPANIRIEESTDPALTEARLYFGSIEGKPLWSGALDATSLQRLLKSPARAALIQRLLEGESVVWIIADNGSPEGKAEADRIEKRLRYLEQVVALPPQDPNDPDSQLGPGPALRLKLGVLRISLRDPEERLFCAMLAGTKCADALAKGEAFAAPVFGRGRVLGSFPLGQLDDLAMEDMTMFLTGRCSCRVKNQSPGWDVLLDIDWETALQKVQETARNQTPARQPAAQPETVRVQPTKK